MHCKVSNKNYKLVISIVLKSFQQRHIYTMYIRVKILLLNNYDL